MNASKCCPPFSICAAAGLALVALGCRGPNDGPPPAPGPDATVRGDPAPERPDAPYTAAEARALLLRPEAELLSGMGETTLLALGGLLPDAPAAPPTRAALDAVSGPFGPPPLDAARNVLTHSRDFTGPVCATQSEAMILEGDEGKVVAAYNSSRAACASMPNYTGYSVSLDHGITWRDMGTPANPANQTNMGDPVLARDRRGNVYMSLISSTGLGVARMAPGSMSFGPWVEAAAGKSGFADKDWLIAAPHPQVPERDMLYLAWLDFGGTVAFRMSRSSDGGATWKAVPGFLTPCPNCQGIFLVASPAGQLHAFFLDMNGDAPGTRAIRYRASADAGVTWTPVRKIADVQRATRTTTCGRDGFVFGSAAHAVRSIEFPSAALQPRTGEIVVTWQDGRNGDSDIYMVGSSDGGMSWKAPFRVNQDTAGDQFMPGVTADDRGFYFQWYSGDATMNAITTQGRYWLGEWRPEQQLSATSFPVQQTNPNPDRIAPCYWGDYNQPAAGDFVHHIWGDTRNLVAGQNQPDVYTVRTDP